MCKVCMSVFLTHKGVVLLKIGKVIDFFKLCLHDEHKCNNYTKYKIFIFKLFSYSSKRTTLLLLYHVFLGLLK